MSPQLAPATRVTHAGGDPDPVTGAVSPPLQPGSIYAHGNPAGLMYGRYNRSTWERLESALADLEQGAAGRLFASGMAAIVALVAEVPAGGRVVVADNAYLGTREHLTRLAAQGHLEMVLVPTEDTAAVAAACQGAALCLLETVTNPLLTVPDLPGCIAAAHAAGALVVVDNTFATPLLCRPLTLGADAVVHSATKYIGGHSDLLLGAVVTRDVALAERLGEYRRTAGGIAGELESWLALRGLRTLDVRLRRQVANAAVLAERLAHHPQVERVHYPGLAADPWHERAAAILDGGFGAMIAIVVRGGAERAEAVCQAARLWVHATSLGGVESTLERRARHAGDASVIDHALLRLSVGIEDVEDLWADLHHALDSGAAARL